MEFFFDNPLANLPGPDFLMLYGAVITVAIIAFQILKHQFDHTQHMSLPPIPVNPDAYEIAFLRGGANELARSVIFALNQKGFLQVDTGVNSQTAVVRQTITKPEKHDLTPLEQRVYDWFREERKTQTIFLEFGLLGELSSFGATYEERLRQLNLLTNETMHAQAKKFKWLLFLGVAGLGSYKLCAALVHGRHNIGFLELMTLGALVIFAAMRLPRVSHLGNLYLERLQLAFGGLKSQIQLNKQSDAANGQTPLAHSAAASSAVDPMMLAVGVFGVSALAGTVYDNYLQAFHRGQQQDGTCGASCGGGGGCGGSGGGGCGGGGCGGCGGGCGGCGG